MKRKIRIASCLVVLALAVLLWLPSQTVQAAADLTPVKVKITIENPDYFWKYPFWGRPLDAVRIYGLGQTAIIEPQSGGETVLFNVPNGYKLKLTLSLQSGGATVKEMNYLTEWGAAASRNQAEIRLSAPEPAAVQIKVTELETTK